MIEKGDDSRVVKRLEEGCFVLQVTGCLHGLSFVSSSWDLKHNEMTRAIGVVRQESLPEAAAPEATQRDVRIKTREKGP